MQLSRKTSLFTFGAIALFLAIHASAQQQEQKNMFNIAAELKLTGIYTSPVRTLDSSGSNAFAMGTAIILRHKSGFGISYAPFFLPSNRSLFMYALTLSYEQFDKKAFNAIAEFNHYFMLRNPAVPYAPINNEFYWAFTLKEHVLSPLLKADVGFGKDSTQNYAFAFSAIAGGGVSHTFSSTHNGLQVSLTPSLLMNWGTNQYFQRMLGAIAYHVPAYGLNQNTAYAGHTETGNTLPTSRTFRPVNTEMAVEGDVEWNNLFLRSDLSYFLPLDAGAQKTPEKYWQVTIGVNFK